MRINEYWRDLDSETATLNGEEISMLEVGIRLLYSSSLKGNKGASLELEKIRSRSGADVPSKRLGCLVVPEPISDDEFEKLAFEQQAQFRERNYGSDGSQEEAAVVSSTSIATWSWRTNALSRASS